MPSGIKCFFDFYSWLTSKKKNLYFWLVVSFDSFLLLEMRNFALFHFSFVPWMSITYFSWQLIFYIDMEEHEPYIEICEEVENKLLEYDLKVSLMISKSGRLPSVKVTWSLIRDKYCPLWILALIVLSFFKKRLLSKKVWFGFVRLKGLEGLFALIHGFFAYWGWVLGWLMGWLNNTLTQAYVHSFFGY